jgi:hypothetical protein
MDSTASLSGTKIEAEMTTLHLEWSESAGNPDRLNVGVYELLKNALSLKTLYQ